MARQAAQYALVVVDAPPPRRRHLRLVHTRLAPASNRPHGTRAKYVRERCGCAPCTAANRLAERQRQRRPGPAYYPAGPVREHLRWLQENGVGRERIHELSGVARSVIDEVRSGRQRRVRPDVGERLMAVARSAAAPGALVDAGSTWKLLEQLLGAGRTRAWLAVQLGSTAANPQLRVPRTNVTARTARAVEALARKEGILL